MALDARTSANMAGTNVTVAERWLKMYRKIHNLFLRHDFTNRNDFEFTLEQINLRITQLETNVTKAVTEFNARISALDRHALIHTHATAALGPPVPALPAHLPGSPIIFSKSKPAQSTQQFVVSRDSVLQSTGEPVVPV